MARSSWTNNTTILQLWIFNKNNIGLHSFTGGGFLFPHTSLYCVVINMPSPCHYIFIIPSLHTYHLIIAYLSHQHYIFTIPSSLSHHSDDYYLMALPLLCHHDTMAMSWCSHRNVIIPPSLCHHGSIPTLSHRHDYAITSSSLCNHKIITAQWCDHALKTLRSMPMQPQRAPHSGINHPHPSATQCDTFAAKTRAECIALDDYPHAFHNIKQCNL